MRKIILAASLAVGALQFPATQAANSSAPFDVTITLTSVCTIGTISAVDFAYTSFGALTNSTGGTFNLTCTNTLPVTFGLQAGAGPAVPPGTATLNVTDNAVNLAYTLSAPAAATGTGLAVSKTITGSMAAAQSGNCASASCSNTAATNKTQTLIVNF